MTEQSATAAGGANHQVLQGLRDGGFDGTPAYEMCSPLRGGGTVGNLDVCARRFLEWLAAAEASEA